jgi:NAD(P)H-flavin reductase
MVEPLDDGEVSPYLTEDLRVGDQLELRGPVGGYFGSGVVPLRAILRQREHAGGDVPVRLL